LDTLLADASSSKRMHRLLQGDVGSGKTVVAFLACLPALNEGYQVAWMAPTEILARQAYATIKTWLEKHDLAHALLTGSTRHGRSDILAGIRNGTISIVVGTHALLQSTVSFKRLGMIVIDEQHRFGAQQRLQLQQKDPSSDLLLMSATPIPQTLSKTLYGDLDIVTIKSRPHGRGSVRTHVVPEAKRADMEKFIAEKLRDSNRQAFFIVPRIDRSEEEDDELQDIDRLAKNLARGPLKEFSTATVHGRQPEMLRNQTMQEFSEGKTKILLATTVVEVGIDVPAAGVIVIENAERFGLSQLHQLRGRVGRNGDEAYCFVFPGSSIDEYAEKRLKAFCRTLDGFDIAEQDLLLRGPGEVTGYRQSGWSDLRIADILRDADLFRQVLSDLDEVCRKKH
jgi:ATP-dependent DNA helicase RecG